MAHGLEAKLGLVIILVLVAGLLFPAELPRARRAVGRLSGRDRR